MTAQVTEAPPALEWLRGTLEEHRKSIVGLRMKVAALEADAEIRDKREADLREELRVANETLDFGSTDLKEGLRQDVLADLLILAKRDAALSVCLVYLAAKTVGVDGLQRLGVPADQLSIVRSMAGSAQAAPVPPVTFDGGNGMRYTPPPVVAQEPPRTSNRVTYTQVSAEEHLQIEMAAEVERKERGPALMPRRASDRAG